MDQTLANVARTVKGGDWADDEGDILPDDWKGEQGSPEASTDVHKTYKPMTESEQEDEILEENHMSPEVLSIVSARVFEEVEKRFQGGGDFHSHLRKLDDRMRGNQADIESWREQITRELASLKKPSNQPDALEATLARINERLTSIEFRLQGITSEITQRGPDEVRALNEAIAIIKSREANEEEGTPADNISEPSILGRLEASRDKLTQNLRSFEPYVQATPLAPTVASSAAALRKKFSKF